MRVNLRSRLERLERALGAVGRCPTCRDRPDVVYRVLRQDSPDATARLERGGSHSGEPCPDCGWAPEVMEIFEVVVRTREDVARMARMEANSFLG